MITWRKADRASVVKLAHSWASLSSAQLWSGHVLAFGCGRPRVHVAAAVEVVVDLGSAAEHAGIEEDRERARLEASLVRYRRRRVATAS